MSLSCVRQVSGRSLAGLWRKPIKISGQVTLFAPRTRILLGVSENHKEPEVRWRVSENSRPRSAIFWWLVAEHDALLEAIDGNQLSLVTLCETIARRGLTDTKGNLPTKRNVRETWLQARKYVAKRRAAKRAAAIQATTYQPSRLPPSWQPQAVSRSFPAPAPPAAERVLSEHAKAELASLDRQLAYRDRFVNPPKKER